MRTVINFFSTMTDANTISIVFAGLFFLSTIQLSAGWTHHWASYFINFLIVSIVVFMVQGLRSWAKRTVVNAAVRDVSSAAYVAAGDRFFIPLSRREGMLVWPGGEPLDQASLSVAVAPDREGEPYLFRLRKR